MSRTVIAVVAAAVIAVLTLTTFLVTRNSESERGRKDARALIRRSTGLLGRTAALESLSIQKRVEALASDSGFLAALKATANAERATQANLAFGRFKAGEKGDRSPDILAIVNATGDILAMDGVNGVVPGEWKGADGKLQWPAIAEALRQRIFISEVWNYPRKGLMKVGVASVIDPEALSPTGGPVIVGAVVIAYSITSAQAASHREELGSEVAYFYGPDIFATSFRRGNDEDTSVQPALAAAMKNAGLEPGSGVVKEVTVGGVSYLAAALRLPRYTSKDVPADYPKNIEGALILQPTAAGQSSTGMMFIVLLGLGSIVITLSAMYLSNRRILGQVDQVETSMADIINGNVDRTFRPVGKELDGLANGLNVMLARLLGRPEPGEEELDDDGNPIVVGRVEFDEQEAEPQPVHADPELARLAEESEPDYYKRVYTEYRDARKAIGSPDEGSFENFIAKLKMNEGKLKAQHQCKMVRFRVITKDGKVSLKPVPIFV